MLTKIVFCGIALGLISALSAVFDRSPTLGGLLRAQSAGCAEGDACQQMAAAPRASTDRFFTILAMR